MIVHPPVRPCAHLEPYIDVVRARRAAARLPYVRVEEYLLECVLIAAPAAVGGAR